MSTCSKCRWWNNNYEAPPEFVIAECRRRAPMSPLVITMGPSYSHGVPTAVFPTTRAGDSCGDFEERT
jgi:hypothetical protein